MQIEMRKKMMVFFLSFLISSLVKMRLREMMTPAVPGKKELRLVYQHVLKRVWPFYEDSEMEVQTL